MGKGSHGRQKHISATDLKMGDIILTGTNIVHNGNIDIVHLMTQHWLSHVMLYAGHQEIVDSAHGRGVQKANLIDRINGCELAVALRHRHSSNAKNRQLVNEALKIVEKKNGYSLADVKNGYFNHKQPSFRKIKSQFDNKQDHFTCSGLVTYLFKKTNFNIGTINTHSSRPTDYLYAYQHKIFQYVGHLKGNRALSKS